MSAMPVPTFYQSKHYTPIVSQALCRSINEKNIAIDFDNMNVKGYFSSYFNQINFDRAGVMLGEYVLVATCNILLDQEFGEWKCCAAWEDPNSSNAIDHICYANWFSDLKTKIMRDWNAMPLIEDPIVLSDPYVHNYYHFSLEMIPRLRHFRSFADAPLVVSEATVQKRYQTSLIAPTCGDRSIILPPGAIRVRNPMVSHGLMSEESVQWLRGATGISVRPGKRWIYIRRSGRGTRSLGGGGISETDAFLALLDRFGFESVDFGDGDLTVEEQAARLQGAQVILAAHGASLTNIVYLNPPVTIIEMIGARTPCFFYAQIASFLGFRYRALVTSRYDDKSDMVVDVDRLREELSRCRG